MIKNNKGVTIISLVVAIVILAILAGVSIQAWGENIDNVRVTRIVSNMTLVKAKVELIYDNYTFDKSALVGTVCNNLPMAISNKEKRIIEDKLNVSFNSLSWYSWDKNDLKNQGLDENLLGDNEYFYVNYQYGEILYSNRTSNYYSLTGLKTISGQLF